jgi:hypothetical protein
VAGFDAECPAVRRLRGNLLATGVGARGIGRAAQVDCRFYRLAVAAGVSVDHVAIAVHGLPPQPPISPIAAQVGRRFEAWVTGDDERGRPLVDAYAVRTPPPANLRVLDLSAADNVEAVWRTEEAVSAAAGGGDPPGFVLQAGVELRFGSWTALLRPDYLWLHPDGGYRVGEIKAYLYRVGRMDPHEVASAAQQAAVSVAALRQLASRLGVSPVSVPAVCDLVLRSAGKERFSVSTVSVEGELLAVEQHAGRQQQIVDDAVATHPAVTLENPAALGMVGHRWTSTCRMFCALDPLCRAEAERDGLLELLGGRAERAARHFPTVAAAAAAAEGCDDLDNPEAAETAEAFRLAWGAVDETEAAWSRQMLVENR